MIFIAGNAPPQINPSNIQKVQKELDDDWDNETKKNPSETKRVLPKYYKITIASGAKEPKTFIDSKHFKYKMIISELYFSTFTTWIIKTLL